MSPIYSRVFVAQECWINSIRVCVFMIHSSRIPHKILYNQCATMNMCGGLDGKPLLNVYKYFICVIHTIHQERYTINDISLFAFFPFEACEVIISSQFTSVCR